MNTEQFETVKTAYVAANYNRVAAELRLVSQGWQDHSSLRAALDAVTAAVVKPLTPEPRETSDQVLDVRTLQDIQF